MATSGASSSAVRAPLPQAQMTTTDVCPDRSPTIKATPLLKNSLPYAREDYERMGELAKTPLLDFLILGNIPDVSADKSQLPVLLDGDFAAIFKHCLIFGETQAIEFLWRQSGLNPDDCVICLPRMLLNDLAASELQQQCRTHGGLSFDLSIDRFDASVIPCLSRLIKEGKVSNLYLDAKGASPESLLLLAKVLGQVGNSLTLQNAVFDIQSEAALAESLSIRPRLKQLSLNFCDFGVSKGLNFVNGMQLNDSVVALSIGHSPMGNSLGAGYGELIRKNSTITSIHILSSFGEQMDIDSILFGALHNKALHTLSIHCSSRTHQQLRFPESLFQLIEKNRALVKLRIPVRLSSDEDEARLAQIMRENTSLIYFDLDPHYQMSRNSKKAIDDVLDRNYALTHGPTLLKAGQAFDPHDTVGNGMAGTGALIARNILQNVSSLNEFADTMAHIELSMRELVRMPQPVQSMTTTTTAAGISTTLATTSTTNVTTTTTTANSGISATSEGVPNATVTITTSPDLADEARSTGPKSS